MTNVFPSKPSLFRKNTFKIIFSFTNKSFKEQMSETSSKVPHWQRSGHGLNVHSFWFTRVQIVSFKPKRPWAKKYIYNTSSILGVKKGPQIWRFFEINFFSLKLFVRANFAMAWTPKSADKPRNEMQTCWVQKQTFWKFSGAHHCRCHSKGQCPPVWPSVSKGPPAMLYPPSVVKKIMGGHWIVVAIFPYGWNVFCCWN